jgi:predicted nucleic acid-binding protein
MERVYQYCKQPITVDKTNEIVSESQRLAEKYYECHSPDNLILATAKVTGSTLVSFDRDLLQTAKMEGVQAFLPRNYIRWG